MKTFRGRHASWSVCALLLCGVLLSRCAAAVPATPPARHLVLVTIDTLRADRVGVYGHARAATPRLDAIAREGAMALQATAHVPLTLPSHATLFSGRLPMSTGVRDNLSAVAASLPLMADVLGTAGFATAAFVSSVVLGSRTGLNRGFDVYDDSFGEDASPSLLLNTLQARGDTTLAKAIGWLERVRHTQPEKPLFLWLHLYDPHDPYTPPEPYASRFADAPYDGELAWSDELVGRLDDVLARLHMREDTLFVVTSDHGEGLGEHGELQHGFFAYESTLRVPLLVRARNVAAGTRLAPTVGLIDVFPTVLDLLEVPKPASVAFDGRSLGGALRGAQTLDEPDGTYAESLTPRLHFGWNDLRVLRDGRWKYIEAPRPELYDLSADPGEQVNLAATNSKITSAMRDGLARIIETEGPQPVESRSWSLPGNASRRLTTLGYVTGRHAGMPVREGADPKDKIEDFQIVSSLIRNGVLRLQERDYVASVAQFQQVLSRGVQSFDVYCYLARGLLGLGRRSDAQRTYELALALNPTNAELLFELGELARDDGRVDEAVGRLRQAVALNPASADYWNALGVTLGGAGAVDEADVVLRAAVQRDPQNYYYAYNLGFLLLKKRETDEARRWFERSLVLNDSFVPARQRLAEIAR